MPIPQRQLDTWSNQGATAISSSAYNSIRTALLKTTSPLFSRGVNIFLQGSYGNSTNIYGNSDIDVVVLYENTFGKDMSALPLEKKQLHEQTYGSATYTWQMLQNDILSALRSHFGASAVTQGNKAIKVQTPYGRMTADVVPAIEFRKYAHFNHRDDLSAHWGIQFHDLSGRAIINYPKYHIERGEDKNSQNRTAGKYKQVVRIFKNLRDHLVDNNLITKEEAPSYFVECALHNVPDALFAGDFSSSIPNILTHLLNRPHHELYCQNRVTMLIGTDDTQWSPSNYNKFVITANKKWLNW
jgi:hypothetical protein